ncbi:hypothetical protein SCLCIDRAFT_794382 [Scleroderma citrinum Foug A]|uniref:Uncharacterized protein n=1 Tax=Scleroderma citrinum Foug A TaxID=1036808 RepID=A0A0C3D2E1_9AGAM|nr:hypothetical protein SCLCIDRAFT_794382 [Scleroderma citrinum Foug A]
MPHDLDTRMAHLVMDFVPFRRHLLSAQGMCGLIQICFPSNRTFWGRGRYKEDDKWKKSLEAESWQMPRVMLYYLRSFVPLGKDSPYRS